MIIKAQSPAGFAEEYIIESIWNSRFPPGSILPAERELSELIGVTRTTLREVLHRLARDGWLTIRHGKPTRVNNVWETSGLNILETLARLDANKTPELIEHLLSARTHISSIFIRSAIRHQPTAVEEAVDGIGQVADDAEAYSVFDYEVHHRLAFASGNPIYGLILNGFKGLYCRVGRYYFSREQTRALAMAYYRDLAEFARQGDADGVAERVREYGKASGLLWQQIQEQLSGEPGASPLSL
ncbi:fatty acid metabolism transcriptional regulator FadR [Oceanimonas baumannii]|uniref:Fatty acid metabolism regulator protein n=1 Tax=Oceanimonas baumannii TaxID=129578 RepID=A0A235CHK4_9GAMM|nr:fatty acid metabolism transcriptional regulator FadR [Oceanimonas baumannii]OYD23869.1 fatty acid metabolism transcriptional regulator FadR [Oceanimonas baumannii]TDW58803.1 GntR family negative regulator for fad regulon and positive regulator of fabA [Oceanimonas baumannii]